MEATVAKISLAVQSMYEAFPYPNYNPFIPLRWQEAYGGASCFAQSLVRERYGAFPYFDQNRFLVAGCGDVQASVLANWEKRLPPLHAIDLSRASLRRARLRSLISFRHVNYQHANLEDPGQKLSGTFRHIDCYGVLHHLANPEQGLRLLSQHLSPGGTMRIMVYNARARQWIFHLRRLFALLGLTAYQDSDLRIARRLLIRWSEAIPALRDRLQSMQPIIDEPARLVDAFFHEREARLSLDYWLRTIATEGLEPIGMTDRFAELDDLPNPLLTFPKAQDLQDRIDDSRFENNFEFYLWKKPELQTLKTASVSGQAQSWTFRHRTPPIAWFRYEETRNIKLLKRWRLWQYFLSAQLNNRPERLERLCAQLPSKALQRLSRLGVVLPHQCQSKELKNLCYAPLTDKMDPPTRITTLEIKQDSPIVQELATILRTKGLNQDRLPLVMARLLKAQAL